MRGSFYIAGCVFFFVLVVLFVLFVEMRRVDPSYVLSSSDHYCGSLLRIIFASTAFLEHKSCGFVL